jgi:hypothetical protein
VATLPHKLEALLALEGDRDFALRTRAVCVAGARAIAAMGELDLIQYEEPDVDGSADLSMWEKIAPLIGATIAEVNTLCAQISSSFPPDELLVDPKQYDIDQAFQRASQDLKNEVVDFGARVRDPSVVGDRWNLIREVQTFRFRFRDRIGKMVWEIAQFFGDCKRREVDPGAEEALASTLVVRTMTADLRRLMRARMGKVSEAGPGEVLTQAKQLEKELNAFGRTAAWRALRSQDKKGLLEFRVQLCQLIASGEPEMTQLLGILEPFVEFVDGFARVSEREILVQHDQEVLASIGVALERAMNVEAYGESRAAYKEAIDEAQTLYGRSVEFDAFLRGQRKGIPEPHELPLMLEQFLVQIAGLSQY